MIRKSLLCSFLMLIAAAPQRLLSAQPDSFRPTTFVARDLPADGTKAFSDQQANSSTPQIPNTAAGKEFATWLRAFNSGDAAQLQAFQNHYAKPEEHNINVVLNIRTQSGGFDLKKIEDTSETQVTVLVQERESDQFTRITMEVEPAAPQKVIRITFRPIERPSEFAIPRLSEAQLIAALRAKLTTDVAAGKFSGTVLLAKDGKIIFSSAYGMADRSKQIPNSLTTKFRIGSMNKMFTAVGILQLIQAGKISLSETVGKYIPDYPNKEIATKVTIEQLLTHTGGTGDIFGPQFDAHRLELRTLNGYIDLYGQRAPQFEPGTRWMYSNYGFVLLGVVIEHVTGESYYDYVNEKIFTPAGMTSTGSLPEDQPVPQRSVGYTKYIGVDELQPNTQTLPYRASSAGGGYSTVGDLLQFANALQSGKLLNAQSVSLLTTGRIDMPRGTKNALGFVDTDGDQLTRHFGHGGDAAGMNGDLEIYPKTGYVIVVLSNIDPPSANRISSFIQNRLPAS